MFLFLQGPASPFFRRLGRALRQTGATVLKVHLCGGDLVFWPRNALLYRGTFEAWPRFIATLIRDRRVTDFVVFGDCRPYHAAAIAAAERQGVALHLFEEGYIRPDWITLEHAGVNARSSLPRSAPALASRRRTTAPPVTPLPIEEHFAYRAACDVLWAISTVVLSPVFPRYRRHTLGHPLAEYPGWLIRLAKRRSLARRDAAALLCLDEAGPVFLFPLQLDGDFQLRVHSRFQSSLEAADVVMASFARAAPPNARLVLKRHPYDVGPSDTREGARRLAATHGLGDRMIFVETGSLAPLMTRSAGMIVINSTSAMVALGQGKPLHVLGRATYDLPGLTHGAALDTFWTAPVAPDPRVWMDYRDVVIATTQVNGSLYAPQGIDCAIKGSIGQMLAVTPARTNAASADHRT